LAGEEVPQEVKPTQKPTEAETGKSAPRGYGPIEAKEETGKMFPKFN
jgi:hypothetical protein